MVGDMKLRAGRALHPGGPDMAGTKRPTGEVQAEKREKQILIEQAEKRKVKSLKKAAGVEHQMETEQMEFDANHPPPSATTKVLRPRREAPEAPAVVDRGVHFLMR
jgi:hypothetical protein